MKDYTDEIAREECSKGLQAILDQINFPTTTEVGKTLSCLIMQTTRVLDNVMGPDYAAATLLKIMEHMATGVPQTKTQVELINRSKLH